MSKPYKTLGNVVAFPWLDEAVNLYVAVTGCDVGDVVVESVARPVRLILGRRNSDITLKYELEPIVTKGLFCSVCAGDVPLFYNRFVQRAMGSINEVDYTGGILQFGGYEASMDFAFPLEDSVTYRTPLGAILCDDASRDVFVYRDGAIRLKVFGSDTEIALPLANYNVDADGWLCIDNEPVRVSYDIDYFDSVENARIQVNSSGVLRAEANGQFRVLQGYDAFENARYAVKFRPYTTENFERCTALGCPVPTDQTLWEGVFLNIPFESLKVWLCYYDIYSLKNIPLE